MATPQGTSVKYTSSGTLIDPGWMWILSIGGIAFAWSQWPGARPFIYVVVGIIALTLWLRDSGRISSQIGSVVSGKD